MERLWMERVNLLEKELKLLTSEREALRFALARLKRASALSNSAASPACRVRLARTLVLLSEVWLEAQSEAPALVGGVEAALRELEGCL